MVCVAGEMLTTPDGLAARATVMLEPMGTGCVRVTVALKLRLMAMSGPSKVRDIGVVATTTMAVPEVAPGADAVMVAELAVAPAVTWNVAEVLFGSTFTLAGTDATLGLLLASVTVWPLGPAAELRVTVMLPVLFAKRFIGLGESEIGATAVVIVMDSACVAFCGGKD